MSNNDTDLFDETRVPVMGRAEAIRQLDASGRDYTETDIYERCYGLSFSAISTWIAGVDETLGERQGWTPGQVSEMREICQRFLDATRS